VGLRVGALTRSWAWRASRAELRRCVAGPSWQGRGRWEVGTHAGPLRAGLRSVGRRGGREWLGRVGERTGRQVWGGKREWAMGRFGLGWAVSWVWLWVCFLFFSFSFLFLNKSNLIEFKPNLNSNPMHSTKQIKLMHQHECTNKFKPKINFNYLRNKILD